MPLTFKQTSDRGFLGAEFVDRYRKTVKLYESSLATESCIWIGMETDAMHLTQFMAADLIEPLKFFVRWGKLPRGECLPDDGAERYWEARWRDEKAENDQLRQRVADLEHELSVKGEG